MALGEVEAVLAAEAEPAEEELDALEALNAELVLLAAAEDGSEEWAVVLTSTMLEVPEQ